MNVMRLPSLLCLVATCGLAAACSPKGEGESAARTENAAPAPAAASTPAPVDVPAGSYTLDKSHASLHFRVSHMGFSNYTARFKRFDATITFDPANLEGSTVNATVDA